VTNARTARRVAAAAKTPRAVDAAAGLPLVTQPGRVPIKSWATVLEESALDQATNLSNLPFAMHHVALMPDAHTGYGMPIGGVLFANRAVVPYAIGVDIGCGVALVETDLTVETLKSKQLARTLEEIEQRVPTGTRGHGHPVDREKALAEIGLPVPESIEPGWFTRALGQLGSLGSGNHFLEVQRDEEGRIHVMLHSGSRSLGKQICDAFHKRALELNRRTGAQLPHSELAYLPQDVPDHARYWAAMQFALRFAEVNRARMLAQTAIAFDLHTKATRFETTVDIHHNYAAVEQHFGLSGIVHRKGAVRARAGETVLIPGSMGTASYVAEGLGNQESFETCQHGAGRAMSRTQARKRMTSKQLFDEMTSLGVVLRSGDPKTAAEEAPSAYKDIESVMAASADLIRPTKRLTPLGVVKG
jgi:tRNA-splicing ligase RtcB